MAAVSVPVCLLAVILSHCCVLVADWFLARWGEAFDISSNPSSPWFNGTCLNCRITANNVTESTSSITSHLPNMPSTVTATNTGDMDRFITLYIIWSCVYLGLTCMAGFFIYTFCVVASHRLHDKMFSALLSTKARFFDVNPIGEEI
ncbi:hypothetical protein ScPMuIL_017666 [Solemya velum]